MKPKYIIGSVIILAALIFGGFSLKKSLTPYVSFAEAQRMNGTVQVMGKLVEGKTSYDMENHKLYFSIYDNHQNQLPVVYAGVKPGNFEQATSIVAIGRYQNNVFQAEQLLVKCPSKYQGLEQGQS